MAVPLMEIGVKIGEVLVCTSRWCYRSICNRPFLVGLLCFLICLHRSFPFLFSFLVSASPVLVCTAVLLGTLLSFGQPNLPEFEIEEKTTYEPVLIKTGVLSGDAVAAVGVEKNESCSVENIGLERRDDEAEHSQDGVDLLGDVLGRTVSDYTVPLIERSRDQVDLSEGDLGGIFSDDTVPLIGGGATRSREVELDDSEGWESNRGLGESGEDEKGKWDDGERHSDGEVVVEKHYAPIPVADDGRSSSDDDEKSDEVDSFGSEKVNVDPLDSPPRSPWTRTMANQEEEMERKGDGDKDEDGDGDDMDSRSDRAESSSPDASMVDIIPMLDELHPLLDQEAPRPAHDDESDASSHDDDDNEDDEDARGDKEEGAKLAITWTKEDQKNLMDLGSSEIERNLRLESLIVRRRARKNTSMLPERDLIDLESLDFPFSVAPILARRQNPFDHAYDSRDNSGLPPIPDSAPSILLPRQNPFDIPYDSSEEKPNLSGDVFRDEFMVLQSKEQFCRHESFNVRPAVFAQEGNDNKIRPYFFPEQTISEESSCSQFQRQSSELSESKASSVTETESVSSVEDLKDRPFLLDNTVPTVEAIQQLKETPSGNPDQSIQKEECTEEDLHRELELTSIVESASEHVGHRSESLEEVESGQVEKAEYENDELKCQLNDITYHDHQESEARAVEIQATEYHENSKDVGQRYLSSSTSSSLSEESERVFIEMESGGMLMLEEGSGNVARELGITMQASIEHTALSITSTALVDDVLHREPIYDSSPGQVRTNLPSPSISLDVPHELVKRTVSFIERKSYGCSLEIESKNIPDSSEGLLVTGPLHESSSIDVVSVRNQDSVDNDLLGINQATEDSIVEKHNLGEICSSSANEVILFGELFEDKNLDKPQENEHLLISETDLTESEATVESQVIDADINHEAKEILVSQGNMPIIHDIQEPISDHPNEVQALSTPVKLSKDDPALQELYVPEAGDVDCDISSNAESPQSPELTSFRSSAFETSGSFTDLHTIVEEVDEIKEIDEGLLSELDNIGDFSVNQWVSSLSDSEKHKECAGGSLDDLETSMMRAVAINSVEKSIVEYNLQSEIPSIDEQVDLSKMDFNESNGRDLPDAEASKAVALIQDNEVNAVHTMEKDSNYVIPEVEFQSIEVSDSVANEADLSSVESKIAGIAEVSSQGQVVSWMPKPEASTTEYIDLAFKKISGEEVKKPAPEAELATTATPDPEYVTVRMNLEIKRVDDSMNDNKSNSGGGENFELPNSVDCTLQVVESGEKLETSFELIGAETERAEGTTLCPNQESGGSNEKQDKVKSNDGPVVKVEEDKVGSSMEVADVKEEASDVTANKPGIEVESLKVLDSKEASDVTANKPGIEVESPKGLDLEEASDVTANKLGIEVELPEVLDSKEASDVTGNKLGIEVESPKGLDSEEASDVTANKPGIEVESPKVLDSKEASDVIANKPGIEVESPKGLDSEEEVESPKILDSEEASDVTANKPDIEVKSLKGLDSEEASDVTANKLGIEVESPKCLDSEEASDVTANKLGIEVKSLKGWDFKEGSDVTANKPGIEVELPKGFYSSESVRGKISGSSSSSTESSSSDSDKE